MHIRPYLPQYPFADEAFEEELDQQDLSKNRRAADKLDFCGFSLPQGRNLLAVSLAAAALSHWNLLFVLSGDSLVAIPPLVAFVQSAVLLTIVALVCRLGRIRAAGCKRHASSSGSKTAARAAFALNCFVVVLALQILMAAVMRGASAQYALTDFPTIGGQWFPSFNQEFLLSLNGARTEQGLPDISGMQVLLHVIHRVGALIVILSAVALLFEKAGLRSAALSSRINFLLLLTMISFVCGISAVILAAPSSPVLGLMHSICGFLLFAAALQTVFDCGALDASQNGHFEGRTAEGLPLPAQLLTKQLTTPLQNRSRLLGRL